MSEYTPIDSNIAFSVNTSDSGKSVYRSRNGIILAAEPCSYVKQADVALSVAPQNQVILAMMLLWTKERATEALTTELSAAKSLQGLSILSTQEGRLH